MKAILVITLLFAGVAYADIGSIDLDTTPRMEIAVTMNGIMNYVGPVQDVTIEMFFPQSSPWQTIEDPDLFEKYDIEDKELNLIIRYNFPDASHRYFNYTVALLMDPTAVKIKYNPYYNWSSDDPLSLGNNFSEFIGSTKYANITPSITEKALELASGKDSELEIIKEIFDWVASHLTYSEEYFEVTLNADDVLRLRAGVCDEYSVLFMALIRSLKIPARFVGGRAHSGLEFQYHSWTEVYISGSGWIPIDPTFNQFGVLDPLHIKLLDSSEYHSIITNMTARRVLDADVLPPEISYDVEVVKKYPIYSPVKLTVLNENFTVSKGELIDLDIGVENLRSDYIVPTVRLLVPEDVTLVDSMEKTILLEPYSKGTLSWRIIAPTNLKQGYTIVNESGTYTVSLSYSTPMTIASYPVRKNVTFIVDPMKVPEEIKDLNLEADGWKMNGKMIVKIYLTNNGNSKLDGISITCSSDFLGIGKADVDIGIGEEKEIVFEFTPTQEQEHYEISIEASMPINESEKVVYPYRMVLYSSKEVERPVEIPITNVSEVLEESFRELNSEYLTAGIAVISVLLLLLIRKIIRVGGLKKRLKSLETEVE